MDPLDGLRRRRSAALLLAVALAGCKAGGIGGGSAPVGVTIITAAGAQIDSTQMFECTSEGLNAYAVFSGDGGPTLTQTAATWTSDSPSIVSVDSGTLHARAPGAAVVTAQYLNFYKSVTVQVVPVTSLSIVPESLLPNPPALTDLAEHLRQPFQLMVAFNDGFPARDFSTAATWSLVGTKSAAYVDSATRTVFTNAASDQPITLVADLPVCNRSASQSLRISPVSSVTVQDELGGTQPLPVGYSEALTILANFATPGSVPQNISGFVTVEDNGFDQVVTVTQNTHNLILTGRSEAGGVSLSLSLDTRWNQPTTPRDYVSSELVSVAMDPNDKQIAVVYPDTAQLHAYGTFANGETLPITRHVTWTSTDLPAASASNEFATAGLVTVGEAHENVTLTATAPLATQTQSDDAVVKVSVPQ